MKCHVFAKSHAPHLYFNRKPGYMSGEEEEAEEDYVTRNHVLCLVLDRRPWSLVLVAEIRVRYWPYPNPITWSFEIIIVWVSLMARCNGRAAWAWHARVFGRAFVRSCQLSRPPGGTRAKVLARPTPETWVGHPEPLGPCLVAGPTCFKRSS